MGNLTTVTIYNDALGDFKADPQAFAKALFEGIDEANRTSRSTMVMFGDRIGYLTVHPSRHSSDSTLYAHQGNSVVEINPYREETKRLIIEKPDFVKRIVQIIRSDLRGLEKLLAEAADQRKAGKK